MPGTGLEERFERYRSAGDLDALAEVFDRTADQLLKVARHLSRDEAQAEDLVQATFLAAIEHAERFDASRELVPWLVGILTNKAQVARSLTGRAPDPERLAERSSEDPAHDSELREFMATLERALERVPDAYRQVLRIHLAEGKGAEEIAHEVKRPAGTVRVQLHRGLKHLRRTLPASFALGGIVVLSAPRGLAAMRAHVLGHASALARAGAAGAAGVSTAQVVGGVLVGKKIAVAVGILLVASGAWWAAKRKATRAESAPVVQMQEPARLEPSKPTEPKLAETATVQRETAAAPSSVKSDDPYGSLDMEWVWADGTPAARIGVGAQPMGDDHPLNHSLFDLTDEQGHITFERLHEGKVLVGSDRGCNSEVRETSLTRGRRKSERFVLPAGRDLRGTVVDKDERPVAGANVWITGYSGDGGVIVAQSDTSGTYFVRAVDSTCYLFASADRFGSSLLESLRELKPQADGTVELDLHLRGESGGVEGVVRDPEGKPIRRAWVTVRCDMSVKRGQQVDWPQVWTSTADDGAFRFSGLHKGQAQVEVDVPDYSVWVRKVLVEESNSTKLDVRVERGFTVKGIVRTSAGVPVADAKVRRRMSPDGSDRWWNFRISAKTNAEGRYRLDLIPSGEIPLVVESRSPEAVLRATTDIAGHSGEVLSWDPVCGEGGKIVGRVVDESGLPLEGWDVETGTREQLDFYPQSAKTDSQGRFEILGCADVPFLVAAYPPHEPGRFKPQAGALAEGVRPGQGELLLSVTPTSKPSAYVHGKVVDEDGKAIGEVQIWAHNEGTRQSSGAMTDKEDGSFQVGPMPSGTYSISLTPKDVPSWNLDPIDIAPDEHRDLGTITIQARGQFELVLRREDGEIVDRPFIMLLRGRYGYPLKTEDGFTFRSKELYPGSYTLCPSGQNIATEQRTIEISRGETAHLELRCRAGIAQVFKFAPPPGEKSPDLIRVVIRDAEGNVVLDRTSGFDMSKNGVRTPSMVAGFAPGRYTYQGTSAGWESSGSFEVADSTQPNGIIQASLVRTP